MTRPTRPSADQTRTRILQAAKKQFLKRGFDATYIQHIAKTAKVNSNLIFHHFNNKETLWRKVKESILSEQTDLPQHDLTSARNFFQCVLNHRFEQYSKHPELVKLLQWQHLTESESALVGNDINNKNHWIHTARRFQKDGVIKKNIDLNQMLLFIIYSTHAPFMQRVIPLTEKQIEQYKQMIIDMCCHQFATNLE